jgi:release factor glutamine methyltransferase
MSPDRAADPFSSSDTGHQPASLGPSTRKEATMTIAFSSEISQQRVPVASVGVYAPQEDSRLLDAAMQDSGLVAGRRVADLCTGSGVVALGAARLGAASVSAFDICPSAVRTAKGNAEVDGTLVDVYLGPWTRAAEFGPFGLVLCNPPYVPHDLTCESLPAEIGPAQAWDAGYDGRLVLDPLCEGVRALLGDGGSLLLVQSEFADPRKSLDTLTASGLSARVVARQQIPFGPVLRSRARWLEETGRLRRGRRQEELVVIRADKP